MDLKAVLGALLTVITTSGSISISNAHVAPSNQQPSEVKYRLLCWLPVPMKSHQMLFEPLLRELAHRNHHITLVTPIPMINPPPNIHQILIKDQFEEMTKLLKMQGLLDKLLPSRLGKAFMNYIESFYLDPLVQNFLNSDLQFDGIIMETLMNDAFIGLHHKYNAPVIDVMPISNFHWSYYLHGIPHDTSYIAEATVPYTDHLTFVERLHNTMVSLMFRIIGETFLLPASQELMDKHLRYPGWETRPTIKDMISNASLVLINTHFSISYPHPLPPHVKEIAGINMAPPKPLPKDLQDFMDSGIDGVIVFSLGSHISMEKTLGPEKTEIFRHFFSTTNYKVLWKHDSHIPNLPNNVKITKWFPQADILGHPNIRLFISHCGFHSSVETIYHGVPAVAIPIQGDQYKNARMLTHYGLALTLNLDNITDHSLSWTVNEVLTNNKFKENAMKRSHIYRDQKETPLETAVYWIEYVLRHEGAHHLKTAVRSMPWYQFVLIDVYITLVVLILIPIVVIYYLIKCTLSKLCRKIKSKISNKKKNS